jgi:hypothetical protein
VQERARNTLEAISIGKDFFNRTQIAQQLRKKIDKWNHKEIKKLKIDLPYNPAIPLLGIYQKERESGYYKGTCAPMFIAVLFTIAKLWKQPRCPTTDEWIKKMWYLYTMEFYSATKNNKILSFAGKWMELENVILSEVSQAQKAKSRMFSLICGV